MTDQTDEIRYALANDIARITLAAPDKLNSLSLAMIAAIPTLVQRAHDDGARAIVLTGEGRAFCTGARLSPEGAGATDLGELIDTYYNPVARAFADSAIPIVTGLNGIAAGAGLGLALCGDIVIAARSGYLLLAFANIGLVPDAGSTWLVAKSIGRAKTLELALLAEKLSVEEAARIGLIARVVDDEAFEAEALAVAKKLAAMPTKALGMIRKQVRHALDDGFEASLRIERDFQSIAGKSADHREGIAAFIEKRTPRFKGA